MIEILRTKEIDGKVILNKEDFEKLIDELESLIETLEIISDKNLLAQISKSEEDIKEGRITEVDSVEEIRRMLFEV